MNINDHVAVRLTAQGREVFEQYLRQLNLDPAIYEPIYFKQPGWFTVQLWELMMIFGPEMRMGAHPMFRNNEIRIGDAHHIDVRSRDKRTDDRAT